MTIFSYYIYEKMTIFSYYIYKMNPLPVLSTHGVSLMNVRSFLSAHDLQRLARSTTNTNQHNVDALRNNQGCSLLNTEDSPIYYFTLPKWKNATWRRYATEIVNGPQQRCGSMEIGPRSQKHDLWMCYTVNTFVY